MRAAELELMVRELIPAVLNGQPVEDSRVELKTSWIEPDKAAKQLAAHANAARGDAVIWIIGMNERNQTVTGIDPLEFESWHKQVEKWFDGFGPALQCHINIRLDSKTIAALYFETSTYAPYVVKNSAGGYPEFSIPWRDGTRVRAARREDLLRLLVPIIKQPQISLVTAKLTLNSVPQVSGSLTIKHSWNFEGLLYITPADEARVVIPYIQCEIWMNVLGYKTEPYRIWASFHPGNYKVPKKPLSHSIKILGKDVDISPPPPRESLTISCAETELLADGPGSAFLVGSGYVIREEAQAPLGNIELTIQITPSRSERPITIKRTLRPSPTDKSAFISSGNEWKM